MKKTLFIALTFGLVAAASVACSKVGETEINPSENLKALYTFNLTNPTEGYLSDEVPATKALTDKFEFSFATKDKIDVVWAEDWTTKLNYPVSGDGKTATFAPQGFTLVEGGTYYAIYPEVNDNTVTLDTDNKYIILSFADQVQDSLKPTAHLASRDLNVGYTTISDKKGDFKLYREVSFLKVTYTNNGDNNSKEAHLTGITVTGQIKDTKPGETYHIDEEIAFNRADSSFTSKKRAETINLSIVNGEGNNYVTVEKGRTYTAYVAVPSGSYAALIITLQGQIHKNEEWKDFEGKDAKYEKKGDDKHPMPPIEVGKYYSISIPAEQPKP